MKSNSNNRNLVNFLEEKGIKIMKFDKA